MRVQEHTECTLMNSFLARGVHTILLNTCACQAPTVGRGLVYNFKAMQML